MSARIQTTVRTSPPLDMSQVPRMALQRKCDCGVSAGLSGTCEECGRAKLIQERSGTESRSPVQKKGNEHSRSAVGPHDASERALMRPHLGHDFGSLSVDLGGPASLSSRDTTYAILGHDEKSYLHDDRRRSTTQLGEEQIDWGSALTDEGGAAGAAGTDAIPTDGGTPATLPGTQTGGTNCVTSSGTTAMTVTNNEACTRDCSVSHEQKHADDIGPCCKKAGAAAAKAEKTEEKEAVQTQFDNWMTSNVNFLECRAYGVSVTCGETKHNKLKCPEAATNDKCCVPIARYLRSSRMQKEGTCNNAGTSLSACPFT